MNKIENEINQLYPNAKILEKIFFRSKKNQVTELILKNEHEIFSIICKYFVWGDCEKENEVIKQCIAKNIKVPQIIKKAGNILIMERVKGKAIGSADIFKNHINEQLLQNVAVWLYNFHTSFLNDEKTLVKGDMRLHNFILSGEDIFGIDFEESGLGDFSEDVIEMSATLCEMEIERKNDFSINASNIFSEKYFELLGYQIPDFKDKIKKCLKKRKAYSDVIALNFFRQPIADSPKIGAKGRYRKRAESKNIGFFQNKFSCVCPD